MGRFSDALCAPGLSVIAEIKRRSPSAGELRPRADPVEFTVAFGRAGAAAVSILVDERFDGTLADLKSARAAAPDATLLAKGFFTEELQLLQMKLAGADAALLLLRNVDDNRAAALLGYAAELQLDMLVEAHDAAELQRAVRLGAEVIGINARDLSTFAVDRRAQLELIARAPHDRIIIAESGINSRAQGAAAELAGADALLVGSALMRAPDPAAKLREVLARPLVKVCGLTREEDLAVAAEAGADLAGFILAKESPRRAKRVLDVPDTMLSVAVFVGEVEDTPADLVQLYGRENGHRSQDAVLLRGEQRVATVIDLPWQQQDPQHLERARTTVGRVMLAGGLSADNVREAIAAVRPWAVDASSRLEVKPGVKDPELVRAYVEAAQWQ
jgi:indole-3-glycerol phosphate synthase / phosphoribosylanthranilate isomerase